MKQRERAIPRTAVMYEMSLITVDNGEMPYMRSRDIQEIMDYIKDHNVKRYAIDKTTIERVIQNV